MQVSIWELHEIGYLYFIYVNPIFLFCAYFNGLELLVIDIIIIFLIDFLVDQAQSKASGERFVHSVFKAEENKVKERESEKRLENSQILKRFLKLKKAK